MADDDVCLCVSMFSQIAFLLLCYISCETVHP